MSEPTIRHISDTARWVAVYRAMESERPDALFRDPYARRLAGERGEQIVRSLRRGQSSAWSMIVRTCLFDDIVLRLVGSEGVRTVVNLAAGLDTRPYRLRLPASLCWIEVDLPGILDHKEEVLAGEQPACALERVRLDLADRDARRQLFARLGAAAGPVAVLSEGFLIYLPEPEVATLAADLAAAPAFAWWLTDLCSPTILRFIQRSWSKVLPPGEVSFQFAPAAGSGYFQPFGWREAEFRSFWLESRRLHRKVAGYWLFQLLGRLRPSQTRDALRTGAVLLARAAPFEPLEPRVE
ncbi:MAG: class I SAM-dependent methyltransferase [Acidobacteriota bacterium]|nr:class I SAM-dependent methyltransferase [Acidobacteriota bacterium]